MRLLVAALAASFVVLPTVAGAASIYAAKLTGLSGSGVTGQADLRLDEDAGKLDVGIYARGLSNADGRSIRA